MKNNLTRFTLLTLFSFSAATPGFAQEESHGLAIRLRAEVWQMPQITALDILDEARGQSDARPLTKTLRERAKAGEKDLKLIAAPSIVSRSGQRSKVAAGEKKYVSDYRVNPKTEKEEPVFSTMLAGTKFEVDPVIGKDRITLDVNLYIAHALEEPTLEATTIVGPLSGKELKVYIATENFASVTTTTVILEGQGRLLGTVPTNQGDFHLVFFLHVDLVEVKR